MMLSSARRDALALGEALSHLVGMPGVVGSVLSARDGLPIATRMESSEGTDAWAAVAAVLGNVSSQMFDAATEDKMRCAVFQAMQCQFLVAPVELGFLLVVTRPEADMELIQARAKSIGDQLNAAARELAASRTE
jgi:predicted regulator of Ras-like GTPase activity (Roadblock/LC7/MglB family)